MENYKGFVCEWQS